MRNDTRVTSNPKTLKNLPCFAEHKNFIRRKRKMSSSSSFGQVLQSCLEPQLLMHQLAPSKQASSFLWPQKQYETPWPETPVSKMLERSNNCQEFYQINTCYNFKQASHETEKVYVHPLAKRSLTSPLSLDMCTESLGNETGSSSSSMDELEKMSFSKTHHPKAGGLAKTVKKIISFPPPLSSVAQIESCREEGRLVIRAFSFSSCNSYFRAERENGRLRLSLLRDGYRWEDCHACGDEEEEEEEEEEGELEDLNADDHEPEMRGLYWGESVQEDEGKVGCWCISRCNGDGNGNKRMTSLPFCVAIS